MKAKGKLKKKVNQGLKITIPERLFHTLKCQPMRQDILGSRIKLKYRQVNLRI
jgi:hypothetical protein